MARIRCCTSAFQHVKGRQMTSQRFVTPRSDTSVSHKHLRKHHSAVVGIVTDAWRQFCYRPHREKCFLQSLAADMSHTVFEHDSCLNNVSFFFLFLLKKKKKNFSFSTDAHSVNLQQILFKAPPWCLVLPLMWIIVGTGDHTWEKKKNGYLGHQWLITKQVCSVWENKTMWGPKMFCFWLNRFWADHLICAVINLNSTRLLEIVLLSESIFYKHHL